jgi:hypothetical protein
MGECLEIASSVRTPIGSIGAIAFVTARYFLGRWNSPIEGRRASIGLSNPSVAPCDIV